MSAKQVDDIQAFDTHYNTKYVIVLLCAQFNPYLLGQCKTTEGNAGQVRWSSKHGRSCTKITQKSTNLIFKFFIKTHKKISGSICNKELAL